MRVNDPNLLFVVVHNPTKKLYLLDIPVGKSGSIEIFAQRTHLFRILPVTSYDRIEYFNSLEVERK